MPAWSALLGDDDRDRGDALDIGIGGQGEFLAEDVGIDLLIAQRAAVRGELGLEDVAQLVAALDDRAAGVEQQPPRGCEPIGGFNLARAIHRRWSSTPVAIVTGEPTRALALRALTAGVVLIPRTATADNLALAIVKLLAPGNLAFSLSVLSETGTSFVPFSASV